MRTDRRGFIGGMIALAIAPRAIIEAIPAAVPAAAPAVGLLHTGGTLKDLVAGAQDFAAAEYSNVFNRALETYQGQYAGKHDAYAPLLSQWQAQSNSEIRRTLAKYNASTWATSETVPVRQEPSRRRLLMFRRRAA